MRISDADWVSSAELVLRPVKSLEELRKAYRLVYETYLRSGYVRSNPMCVRFSYFNALPDAVTFVGLLRGEVVSTVSVIPDSPLMLPMDDIYHDELQGLRDRGRVVAEVTMLADRRAAFKRTLSAVLRLMKLVFDYAQSALKANDLCITINPHHLVFYERHLLFRQIGSLRSYPSVEDNPAVAERLNLDSVREDVEGREDLLSQFFADATPDSVFENRYRLSSHELVDLFVESTDVLAKAPKEAVEYINKFYPDVDLGQMIGRGRKARSGD